jgi:hypothetical protein
MLSFRTDEFVPAAASMQPLAEIASCRLQKLKRARFIVRVGCVHHP